MLAELVPIATPSTRTDHATTPTPSLPTALTLPTAITRGMGRISRLVISLALPNSALATRVNLVAPILLPQVLQGPAEAQPTIHLPSPARPQHRARHHQQMEAPSPQTHPQPPRAPMAASALALAPRELAWMATMLLAC